MGTHGHFLRGFWANSPRRILQHSLATLLAPLMKISHQGRTGRSLQMQVVLAKTLEKPTRLLMGGLTQPNEACGR